ncbi:SAF domain-containing protein [Paenibacillus sp. 453mf]|uniref:SAF domain-containing protein n=1 Tax=Paenibacillus sp. 453mf TaxID=1761874 RepID=UPI0008F4237C|nr:SAF domain-containing protein [Paenibacillus sp. 453mf]SFS58184.1 SAF domain-containing protein [Paenibacillus sp. 453mf]
MSKLRKQSKKKIVAGLIGAGAASILFSGLLLYDWKMDKDSADSLESRHELELLEIKKQLVSEQKDSKTGYVIVHDIPAGTLIKDTDVRAVKVPQGQAPVNLISELDEIAGSVTKIELKAGTSLTAAMLYEEEPTPDDLRNREISVISRPSLLNSGDMIDVRIQFPTGQDYIVLSKKKVHDLEGATMWMTLTEAEILTLSSAMVDAYLHKASLYSLTYVEPEFQDRAIPTYPANEEVLTLIESNPNIVDLAEQALSTQLRSSLERVLSEPSSSNYMVSESIEEGLARTNDNRNPTWNNALGEQADSGNSLLNSSNDEETIWKDSNTGIGLEGGTE